MTSAEILAFVEREINGDWERSNLHGVVLKECLVEPLKIDSIDANGESFGTWVVLHECPPSGPGYAVVFDEVSRQFGLAQFAHGYQPCVIGLYGTFFDALEAM